MCLWCARIHSEHFAWWKSADLFSESHQKADLTVLEVNLFSLLQRVGWIGRINTTLVSDMKLQPGGDYFSVA